MPGGRPAARRVAVVGAGWAGLAAAVEATRQGDAVTLFEMAPQAGGRAREVAWDGLALDNGQHILIGAYTETLRLMRLVGVDVEAALLRTPLRITYPEGAGLQMNAGAPAPAFALAVLRYRSWRWSERLALLRAAAGWALRGFECDAAMTVAQLTKALPQPVRAELIDPLCVAALNTPAGDASARVFLRVLKDALFAGPGSADLLMPRVSLGAAFPAPALRWLANEGAVGAQLAPGRPHRAGRPAVAGRRRRVRPRRARRQRRRIRAARGGFRARLVGHGGSTRVRADRHGVRPQRRHRTRGADAGPA